MGKAITEIRSLARSHTRTALNVLVAVMRNTNATPPARVAAANAILDRGWGKPTQSLANDDSPLPLIRWVAPPRAGSRRRRVAWTERQSVRRAGDRPTRCSVPICRTCRRRSRDHPVHSISRPITPFRKAAARDLALAPVAGFQLLSFRPSPETSRHKARCKASMVAYRKPL
jgi:hypothetical protein